MVVAIGVVGAVEAVGKSTGVQALISLAVGCYWRLFNHGTAMR